MLDTSARLEDDAFQSTADYLCVTVKTNRVEELLSEHRRQIEAHPDARILPPEDLELLAQQHAIEWESNVESFREVAWMFLKIWAGLTFVAGVVCLPWQGLNVLGISVTLAVGFVIHQTVLAFGEYVTFSQAREERRREVQW